VQRLQYFLSESTWDSEQVNNRRLELLLSDPATAPHDRGVLVVDDSGDRKDGTRTAHAGRQWLGRYGKTDNGSVTVTTVWADQRVHYPLHAEPYTPVSLFPKKRGVLPKDAARGVSWGRPDDPAGWSPVQRRFRDGHTETWWTIDAQRGWWGPDGHTRLVVATTDPQTLPDKGNWYLAIKLPGPAACTTPRPAPGTGRPHRGGPAVRDPALDRARLQACQRRARLGWLPSPLRYRDPPPPIPGPLRVLVLLELLVRPTIHTPHPDLPPRSRPPTTPERGAISADSPAERPCWPKALRASAPDSPHGCSCNAGGQPDRRPDRPG
jgi:hypothetical protein